MTLGIVDIDHLMIRVGNLDNAVARFRALGFVVAPPRRSRHDPSVPLRAYDNRFILFQPYPGRTDVANFLALACLQDQFGAPWHLRKRMSFLWDTEGPRTIVCLARDLEFTYEAMVRAGWEVDLAPPPPDDIGWLDEGSGQWIPLRNRPCTPTFRQVPFMFNAYHTDTLESFHHEPWTHHPNSARYLSLITGVSDNISRDAYIMSAQVFGSPPRWISEDIVLVSCRDIALRIVTRRGFEALFPGLDFSSERILPALCGVTIVVSEVTEVRSILATNGVPFVTFGDERIVVPRSAACNTLIEFICSI
jgi:hypothetical protein